MMKKNYLTTVILILMALASAICAQQHTDNKADQSLRGGSRVNPVTLGMEFEIPLGDYRGRGIDLPISIRYSSKTWRLNYTNSRPAVNNPDTCIAVNEARFGENSAAGWTSSMSTPYIEYSGADNLFNTSGAPAGSDDPACTPNVPPANNDNAWVRRIVIHLQSGETHELRMDDNVLVYPASSNCDEDPQSPCDANDPARGNLWSGWYYAIDGSNIRYFEDRANGFYFAQMPDGSRYEFNNPIGGSSRATIRKASALVDRNGNSVSFHGPTEAFPNGFWTDTIGRLLPVPVSPEAPSEPTVQTVSLPGIAGTPVIYKLHWKKLKGATPAESALADFSAELRFTGDKFLSGGAIQNRDPSQVLFTSEFESWVLSSNERFNPVVLERVELPTGLSFRFGYNVFGEIISTDLPTGGKETYAMNQVASISDLQGPNARANRGVTSHTVNAAPGTGAEYRWTYTAAIADAETFVTAVINPDGTRTERSVHRGQPGGGIFGFDSGLSGMVFEERNFGSDNAQISITKTNWDRTRMQIIKGEYPIGLADWHPRTASIESISFDASGHAVSATNIFEFENAAELDQRQTPLLTKKISEYGFTRAGYPIPPRPLRSRRTTYLINDSVIPESTRAAYKGRNLVTLASATEILDGWGNTVSRNELRFDEPGFSPGADRGNPTSSRDWDNSRGAITDASAYVATMTRFDNFGNAIEVIDPRGNSTYTEFDEATHSFPIRVTMPAPDPSGEKGSNLPIVNESYFDPSSGLQTGGRDPNGMETRITFDPQTLRMNSARNFVGGQPAGAVTETEYHDASGSGWRRDRTQIDADNWSEKITYFDGLGRKYRTEEPSAKGNILTDTEFDAFGRVKRVSTRYRVGETRSWTTYDYDGAGRVRSVTLPDGSVIRTDWGVIMGDLGGVLVSDLGGVIMGDFASTTKTITDQAGRKRRGVFDSLGRLRRVIEDPDGLNLKTDYLFDAAGNIRQTVQGSQSRYFSFNSLNRLIYSKMPEQDANPTLTHSDPLSGNSQWSIRYEYDTAGNIVRMTDPRGVTVISTYDRLNRTTKRDYSDGTPDVDTFYDGAGSTVPIANSIGKTTRVLSTASESSVTAIDGLGRITGTRQTTDGMTFNSSYAFNLRGDLISETYPSGRTVSYSLDSDGAISSVATQRPGLGSRSVAGQFSYGADGELLSMRLGNGRWENTEYNSRQQMIRVGLGFSAADRSLLDLRNGFGTAAQNNGSLRSQSIGFRGQASEISQTFDYDSLNRIRSATEIAGGQTSWSQNFEYDRFGNRRLSTGTSTISATAPAKIANPQTDPATNRLKRDQDQDNLSDYGYDSAGNLTIDAENRRFVFDGENRVREFFKSSNTGTTPDGIFKYDGDGRRVMKISASEKTVFVYNATGKLVAEYSTSPAALPRTAFITTDHLGTPRIVTDAGGNVVSRHDYLAFGEDISETLGNVGGRTAANGYGKEDELRHQYTGYQRDDESGLDFAQARYYKASFGRFISVDPLNGSADLKDPQSFNRYSYALNSPYKFVDPLGLISSSTGADGNRPSTNPRRTRRNRSRPNIRGLQPNPSVVVPRNIQNMAAKTTTPATKAGTGEAVTMELPQSMVDLRVALANFVYTNVGAATSQGNANRQFGSVRPETATVTESNESTSGSTRSNSATIGGEISVEPKISVEGSTGSESTTGQTTGSETAVAGQSTATQGTLNQVTNQANLAIVNYLNENADAEGYLTVTTVDSHNTRSKTAVHRDVIQSYLKDFTQRVWNQAFHDYGGR